MDFAVSADFKLKLKESKKRYVDLSREMEEDIKHQGDDNTNWNRCVLYSHLSIGTGTGRLENRKSGDYQDYSIIKIGQNTEKSPGDLGNLAGTQITVRNNQRTLMWKIL